MTAVMSPNYQYQQDLPSFQGDRGTMAFGVRTDADQEPWSDTDGDFSPFQVNARGELRTAVDSVRKKVSYSATGLFTAANSATDIFTISGSSTKTIRINRVLVYGVQTTSSQVLVQLMKRSSANTGGTSAAVTAVPRDSSSAAATASVKQYTANPTVGTLVGMLDAFLTLIPAPSSIVDANQVRFEYESMSVEQPVLRGTAESLCVHLGGATVAGNSLACIVEWTEE